jgi:hypothetical protein
VGDFLLWLVVVVDRRHGLVSVAQNLAPLTPVVTSKAPA